MTTPTPEALVKRIREECLDHGEFYEDGAVTIIEEALTEAAHASALAEAAKHADCCVDREETAEQTRVHTQHLALCGEAQSKQNRERHDLEDRVARQAREIERLQGVLDWCAKATGVNADIWLVEYDKRGKTNV